MGQGEFVGLVLAGGRSSRMGLDKASLPLLGRPLAAWAADAARAVVGPVWLVGGDSALARQLGLLHAPDLIEGAGPLGGLYSGLSAAGRDALVVACDMPFLQPLLLRGLLALAKGCDAVVPVKRGQYEPLVAVYRHSCLPAIERALLAGERRVASIYAEVRLREVAEPEWQPLDPEGLSFVNINRPEDLERVRAIIEREAPWKPLAARLTAS